MLTVSLLTTIAIQGVKVGMMGPLAGVGVFWFTVRPILGHSASIAAVATWPILFFVLWNVITPFLLWYTQEFGYKAGASISSTSFWRHAGQDYRESAIA